MPENVSWREEIRSLLQGVSLPPGREADIVDELAEHLQNEYERALAFGASDPEARKRALACLDDGELLSEQLKGIERSAYSEPVVPGKTATKRFLPDLWQDIRYAGRMFRKNPGFTALAVLSLALGIGANTAMFSIINAVLIRPLPYPESQRVVRGLNSGFYPVGGIVALQQQSRTMDIGSALPGIDQNLTGQGEALRITGSIVSSNLFSVLRVEAQLGRAFQSGDERPGVDNIVILSHSLWRDKFAGEPGVIGRVIMLGDVSRQIVGVMPPGLTFPDSATQFWIPMRVDVRDPISLWSRLFVPVIARLRPGTTLAQAQDEIPALSREMIALYPYKMGKDFNAQATVVPLQEFLVTDIRRRLIVLQSAIALVLLIACANVANLLLARAASRQKEMGLRIALGAARGRIVRQLLTESVLLGLAGGICGIGLASWSATVLKLILPAGKADWSTVSIGWQVLLFTAGLSVLTGLAFGVAPALVASGSDLAGLIKSGGQRAAGVTKARIRSMLIVAEISLAVVLSVGAGLLIRSLWNLSQTNPGFQSQQILTLRVSANRSLCRQRDACVALYDELLRRTRSVPGIYEVAAANSVPLTSRIPSLPVQVEDTPLNPAERVAPLFWTGAVTSDYFRLMRIPILAGRGFSEGDSQNAAPVVIVSASTAQRYWPNQNAIGKHIRTVSEKTFRTVVGVAADVRQFNLSGSTPNQIRGILYMPYAQSVQGDGQPPEAMTLIIRTGGDISELTSRIRELVRNLDTNVPVSEIRTMASLVDDSAQQPRSMAWLFAAFAGVALLLAAIGAYGVVSWSTAQRTFEIGVRVALGAPKRSVFRLVLGQSLRLVACGLVLGVAASFALARMLTAFLYNTASSDAVTFAGVSAIMVFVALLAGYIPARRAANVDPLTALRVE
jgi:putative ABC transport system permease protein